MKTIFKIIFFIILGGALIGCTIVMPAAESANSKSVSSTDVKKPDYQRPTPTTTVESSTTATRPRPPRKGSDNATYSRPTPTTTVVKESVSAESSSKETRTDGRIDNPVGKNNETKAISDTTKQVRGRVRR
jgi:hypothetical protein